MIIKTADSESGHWYTQTGEPAYRIIGKNGVEQILDIALNDAEKATFAKSADAVRNMNGDLKSILG